MLHEILLSLSGVPSPVWQRLNEESSSNGGIHDYISPPEQEMLAVLSNIYHLHLEVKEYAASISSKNYSLVCRAVSSCVVNEQLAAFRKKVIETERSILQGDSAYVGGYQIVPLSTLVADFAPWTRRLEWLRKIMHYMSSTRPKRDTTGCSAATVIDLLDTETHTGYADISGLATRLLTVAQTTWMRSISSWILYGQLPPVGHEDFFIQLNNKSELQTECRLDYSLVPKFVTNQAAENLLAIGNSLRKARSTGSSQGPESGLDMARLLSCHVEKLKALSYPLMPTVFQSFVTSINESISDHTLSKLLPRSKILEICEVLQGYLLLGSGEFATTLIENADARMVARQKMHLSAQSVRKLGRMEGMTFGATELAAILSKTWSDLTIFQNHSQSEAELFDLAKQYLRLTAIPDASEKKGYLTTLLPAPSILQIRFPTNSPLNIFLSAEVLEVYSRISGYLLAIRRCQLRVSSVWKLTSQRRSHPSPIAPPISATGYGRRSCRQRRAREEKRALRVRQFWSSMNRCLFLLNELNYHLQVEVIRSNWKQFESWLHRENTDETSDSTFGMTAHVLGAGAERTSTIHSVNEGNQHRSGDDPRLLAQAHSRYLAALCSGLLLNNEQYLATIKSFIERVDHFVALFGRLSNIWEGLDLQEDEGVMDAFTDLIQDEKDILSEMDRTRSEIEALLVQIVQNLMAIEKAQDGEMASNSMVDLAISSESPVMFRSLGIRTLERLIMRLDFLHRAEGQRLDLEDNGEYD